MAQKIIATLFLGGFILSSFGQQTLSDSPDNYLFGKAGLTQSYMIKHTVRNLYLDGMLEYGSEKSVSWRGSCFFYLDSRETVSYFKSDVLVCVGPIYHFPLKSGGFFLGFQPGIDFSTPNSQKELRMDYPIKASPVLLANGGYRFLFSRLCHFQLELGYLFSYYRGTQQASFNQHAFFISGGLGFQIKIKKSKG